MGGVRSAGDEPVRIRSVVPADDPALAALELMAPDAGAISLRLRMWDGYLALAGRYPNARGYVAVDARGAIVGMIFSSTAPTRCGERTVSGVYLFSLRVHPSVRRRGVGRALVNNAWDDAVRDAGARVGWAAILHGNDASHRTFSSAGFRPTRDLVVRVVPQMSAWLPIPKRMPSGLVIRRGNPHDFSPLATALNAAYARHQLWRPLDGEGLRRMLRSAGQTHDNVWLAVDRSGTICAAVTVFDVGRVADVRVRGLPGIPRPLEAALTPLLSRVSIRPLLVRHALLGEGTPHLMQRLLKAYGGPTTALTIVNDPQDRAWKAVRALPGITSALSIVVRGEADLDRTAPLVLI